MSRRDGGKGDLRRPLAVSEEQFNDSWERIFGGGDDDLEIEEPFTEEQKEKYIEEIVDFYMQYVTDFHSEIRESLEYSWKCMSDMTLEDYLDIVRERKEKQHEQQTTPQK